jgi:hypothetical protein
MGRSYVRRGRKASGTVDPRMDRRRTGNVYCMGRVALLTFVLAVLLAGTASGGTPKRTGASGTIAVLAPKRVVIDGKRDLSCRIGVSLSRIMGAFAVGDHAKITCRDGLLSTILGLGPGTTTTQSSQSSSSSSVSSSTSVSTSVTRTSTGESKMTTSVSAAIGPIGALTAGSITVGPITCSIGSGSPSTSGFKSGDRVTLHCANEKLTGLSHVR